MQMTQYTYGLLDAPGQVWLFITGGDFGGTAPKFEVEDKCMGRPSPQYILRTFVIGCEEKYELTKKGLQEEFWVVI